MLYKGYTLPIRRNQCHGVASNETSEDNRAAAALGFKSLNSLARAADIHSGSLSGICSGTRSLSDTAADKLIHAVRYQNGWSYLEAASQLTEVLNFLQNHRAHLYRTRVRELTNTDVRRWHRNYLENISQSRHTNSGSPNLENYHLDFRFDDIESKPASSQILASSSISIESAAALPSLSEVDVIAPQDDAVGNDVGEVTSGHQRYVAELLFRDDFDGERLDLSRWGIPVGRGSYFGRAQINPNPEAYVLRDSVLNLTLSTYNPSARRPGDLFFGSEIVSRDVYSVKGEQGIRFTAMVRFLNFVPRGVVGSLFGYSTNHRVRSEITFELFESQQLLTNAFDDDDFAQPGDLELIEIPSLDLTSWNELSVNWFEDRIEWYVNGNLMRVELDTLPNEDLSIRLNVWSPDEFFDMAYSELLQPVATPEESQEFTYQVDYVSVERLSLRRDPLTGGAVESAPVNSEINPTINHGVGIEPVNNHDLFTGSDTFVVSRDLNNLEVD